MSALFSEIYGCYYSILRHILNRAKDGMPRADIEELVAERGFSETAFHLIPALIGGEWNLLEKRGELYYSKLSGQADARPVTDLELSWLAAVATDPRIGLFLDGAQLAALKAELADVQPIFDCADFICLDNHLDGDPYTNPMYIDNFRIVLAACKAREPLEITYASGKRGQSKRIYYPYKLSYSELNDKFRLMCAVFNVRTQKCSRAFLNLGRMVSAQKLSNEQLAYVNMPTETDLKALFSEPYEAPPIILEICTERNALERFMLQFASFERKTEYDPERDLYTCYIHYDPKDEMELLIRILSFGYTVKVLSPPHFLAQIKERIAKQMQLMP